MKKLSLPLLVIVLFLTSCNRYTGVSNGKGCGVWYPKKFEKGKVWVTRDHPMYRHGKGW